ncbi:MAG: hypothetical protein DYH08_08405 [Actinobacteria bacterium ATB1]|nr:hypothetical protein [Actinobacteria bacterium ATB1]
MTRILGTAAAVLLALTILSACGGDSGGMGSMGGHMHGEEASDVAAGAREVEVTADSFEFSPPRIEATAGEDLAIVLTSEDSMHDFVIDELDAHVVAQRGETAKGGVNGLEPGTYTYYCSVSGHRNAGMEGKLVVS